MLTICLDESGNFEEEKYHKALIVGGVVYTGDDFEDEEKRLKQFYINACDEIASELSKELGREIIVEYPQSLHSTDNNKFNKNIETIPQKINKLLNKKVMEYIKKSGKYNLTAMLKNSEMEEDLEIDAEEVSVKTMVDFKNGSNLYERMATKFLYNNIFYNPILADKNNKVNLNLATRTIKVEKDSELFNQLKNLDYGKRKNDDGAYRFFVTEAATFRSALSTKIYESEVNKNIECSLNVESIDYKEGKTTPYLYLADNICDIIRNEIREIKGELNILKLIEVIKAKTGNDMFCFIHDDVDLIWTRLIEKIQEGNLIGAFEKIGEIKKSNCKHKDLYINFWVPKVKDKLEEIFNEKMMDTYLGNLDYYFTKEASSYEKGMEIAQNLLELIENKNVRNKEYIKYRINEKIALSYNHRGAIDKSLNYFNACEKLKTSGVSVMEYLSTMNRKTVALMNACAYEEAMNELSKHIKHYEKIECAYLEIAATLDMESEKSYEVEAKGKILSGLGQSLAFMRKYSEAEEKFIEALNTFKDNGNRAVTNSYLIHLYIETRDKENYEKQIKEIYQTTDLKEQMKKIFSAKKIDRYGLFIYVKALNVLYSEEVDEEFVINLENKIKKFIKDSDFNQHPKELVIKHLAQLLYKKGLKTKSNRLMEKHIDTIEDSEFTIKAIIEKAKIDYLELRKNEFHINNEVERRKIDKIIINHIDNLKEEIKKEEKTSKVFEDLLNTESLNVIKCKNIISERLTYMYN